MSDDKIVQIAATEGVLFVLTHSGKLYSLEEHYDGSTSWREIDPPRHKKKGDKTYSQFA